MPINLPGTIEGAQQDEGGVVDLANFGLLEKNGKIRECAGRW